MLQTLDIQNYALIDKLLVEFDQGFSVITGETGAGKSILLGALGLVLGQKAEARMVRSGARKCVVEAQFKVGDPDLDSIIEANDLDPLEEGILILRREVTQDGRSRCFVNDSPAPLSLLRQIAPHLIDIHSQHQNLLLDRAGFQIGVLDAIALNEPLRNEYSSSFREYTKLSREIDLLKTELAESREKEDWIRYQAQEMEKASLGEDEQALLEQEQEMLEHSEEIKTSLYGASQILSEQEGSALELIRESLTLLDQASRHYDPSEQLMQRLQSLNVELKDITSDLSRLQDKVDYDPKRLEEVSERLSLIYSLQKKHHVSDYDELLQVRDRLLGSLENLDGLQDRIHGLEKQFGQLSLTLHEIADRLTESRRKASQQLRDELLENLALLGMPFAEFKVSLLKSGSLKNDGQDDVTFLFASNKGSQPQDISKVASGGEIARLMLTLKAILIRLGGMPTVIFDEVDTGTGGETASRMASMMQRMASGNQQVIAITHLPQIASRGTSHYKVSKTEDGTSALSTIVRLDQNERIEELARMLSGDNLTEAAVENARMLLEEAGTLSH